MRSHPELATVIRDYAVKHFDAKYRLGDISTPTFWHGEEIGDKIQCDNGEQLYEYIIECIERVTNRFEIIYASYEFIHALAFEINRHIIYNFEE